MDDKKKFFKTLSIQVGLLFAIIIPLSAGTIYLRHHIKNKADEIVKINSKLQIQTQAIESIATLRKQNEQFGDAYFNVLNNIVPQKDKLIDLSRQFQTIAQSEGIGFGFSFVEERVPNPPELGFIGFSLSINSDNREGIISFIKKLENFRYLTTISKIDIERNSQGNFRSSIYGKVYFQ